MERFKQQRKITNKRCYDKRVLKKSQERSKHINLATMVLLTTPLITPEQTISKLEETITARDKTISKLEETITCLEEIIGEYQQQRRDAEDADRLAKIAHAKEIKSIRNRRYYEKKKAMLKQTD
jgi:hypothetical protein